MNFKVYSSNEQRLLNLDVSQIPVPILPSIPYDVLRLYLVDSWKYVKKFDSNNFFMNEAKEYSHMVTKPMYLSLIKKNIEDAKYQTFESFSHDVVLMCENAIHCNGIETDAGKLANRIKKCWLMKYKEFEDAIMRNLLATEVALGSSTTAAVSPVPSMSASNTVIPKITKRKLFVEDGDGIAESAISIVDLATKKSKKQDNPDEDKLLKRTKNEDAIQLLTEPQRKEAITQHVSGPVRVATTKKTGTTVSTIPGVVSVKTFCFYFFLILLAECFYRIPMILH